MFKTGLTAILFLVPLSAQATGINFAVTAAEYRAFPSMNATQQFEWLRTVMRRGCPVQVPNTMGREEAISSLDQFKPSLSLVLSHMRGDCESAMASQGSSAPTVRVKAKSP